MFDLFWLKFATKEKFNFFINQVVSVKFSADANNKKMVFEIQNKILIKLRKITHHHKKIK